MLADDSIRMAGKDFTFEDSRINILAEDVIVLDLDVSNCEIIEVVESLPGDYAPCKYKYIDGTGFVLV
jgi:hypothetical protein